jgi:hypothetical protein
MKKVLVSIAVLGCLILSTIAADNIREIKITVPHRVVVLHSTIRIIALFLRGFSALSCMRCSSLFLSLAAP